MAPRARARKLAVTALSAFALLAPCVRSQAMAEPSGNQILMGAWVDTVDDGTTPAQFNIDVQQNFSYFQLTQNMPLVTGFVFANCSGFILIRDKAYDYVTGAGGLPPEWLIDQTQTDAGVFLTVYPQTFSLVDADYQILIDQISNYTSRQFNRTTFLRFAPEMQGLWMPYGFQPVAFKSMWIDMYTRIKKAVPSCIIVWAPNLGVGYPYGQTAPTDATELAALDTNGDGTVTAADDPFAPWYPGDDYVDWIGLSVYFKGPGYQNINTPQIAGYCADVLQNIDSDSGTQLPENFYEVYCTKANKACMFAESGAAYHVDSVGTGSQLALQSAWISDCINNDAFLDQFPRLKMLVQFEFLKSEDITGGTDLRDFRVHNDTAVRSVYVDALSSISTRVQWAQSRSLPPNVPATGTPATVTGGTTTSVCTKYCGVVTFHTQRVFLPEIPTLFGVTRESAAARLQATFAVGFASVGLVSATIWLQGRRRHQK